MMKPTIIAVDLSAIFYTSYHATANEQIPVSKQYHNTMVATLSKVNHIRTLDMGVSDPRIVVCCDDRKNWRKDIDRTYKAQREKQDAGFYDALERTKERLSKDGFPVLQREGFEADDVIASLCQASQAYEYDVIIASPDKDLLQLVSDNARTQFVDKFVTIRQLRTHKMFLDDDVTVKLYDEAMVESEFGVRPSKFADYLALVGDKSDNIFGIEGVGGKAAPAILTEFGTLSGLLGAVEARDEQTPGVEPWANKKSLNRCATALTKYFRPDESGKAYQQITNLSRNRILVSLKSDVPIDMDDVLRERKVEKLSTPDEPMDAEFSKTVPSDYKEIDGGVYINNPAQSESPQKDTEIKAIATVEKRSVAMTQFDVNLQPTGMEAVYWYAKRAMDSRVYLKKFSNEDACLMAIMRGKDYGLSMTAALETLHVIEGRVCLPAQFMVTLARRNTDCEYIDIIESDDVHCIMETKRKRDGKVFRCEFKIEEAKRAGLIKPNSNWEKWPIDMCVARCASRLCRRVWTEAMGGGYSLEEMQDAV